MSIADLATCNRSIIVTCTYEVYNSYDKQRALFGNWSNTRSVLTKVSVGTYTCIHVTMRQQVTNNSMLSNLLLTVQVDIMFSCIYLVFKFPLRFLVVMVVMVMILYQVCIGRTVTKI